MACTQNKRKAFPKGPHFIAIGVYLRGGQVRERQERSCGTATLSTDCPCSLHSGEAPGKGTGSAGCAERPARPEEAPAAGEPRRPRGRGPSPAPPRREGAAASPRPPARASAARSDELWLASSRTRSRVPPLLGAAPPPHGGRRPGAPRAAAGTASPPSPHPAPRAAGDRHRRPRSEPGAGGQRGPRPQRRGPDGLPFPSLPCPAPARGQPALPGGGIPARGKPRSSPHLRGRVMGEDTAPAPLLTFHPVDDLAR